MGEYILKTGKDGTNIAVRNVRLALLGMLKDIDALCERYNIRYWLTGGSALSAVRHKGFILWGDDTDIGMLREDYERFQRVVHELGDAYITQCFKAHREYNVLVPSTEVRKEDTHYVECNALLKNKCRDGDGLFVDTFVLDHVSKNKVEGFIWCVRSGILMVLIVFFENLHCNPLLLKRRFVHNAKKYRQISKDIAQIGYDLTWTFSSFFHPAVYSLESVFPIQYVELEDIMLPVPKRPKDMLDIGAPTRHMSYPPLKDQTPKHIRDIELQTSLTDDVHQKMEGYLWHTHLDRENTRHAGESQYH